MLTKIYKISKTHDESRQAQITESVEPVTIIDILLTIKQFSMENSHSCYPSNKFEIRQMFWVSKARLWVYLQGVIISENINSNIYNIAFFYTLFNVFNILRCIQFDN